MNKIIVLSLILSSISVFGQALSELKKGSTFFILFEEGEFSKKRSTTLGILEPIFYSFYFKKQNSDEKTSYSFRFSYHKYNQHEDISKNKQTIKYRVHKSFLNKNKHLLLSKKDMDKLGDRKMIQLFKQNKKHIFIIDKSETKGNQILIREAKFSFDSVE